MDARHAQRSDPAPRGLDAITVRMAAMALPLGVVVVVVATAVHPHREDVMANRAVFAEYAQSAAWIAVHFAQWLGALLLFAGLVGVYHVVRADSGPSAGLTRLGAAVGAQAAAAITALQAVDGVALKWAVDTWAGAPAGQRATTFAAAEAIRWVEYAFQSYSNILLGLTLVLFGAAIALGVVYPQWVGWLAVGSGVGWAVHGVMVAYVGLFDSAPRLAAEALLALWAFVMAFLMWRTVGQRSAERHPERVG